MKFSCFFMTEILEQGTYCIRAVCHKTVDQYNDLIVIAQGTRQKKDHPEIGGLPFGSFMQPVRDRTSPLVLLPDMVK